MSIFESNGINVTAKIPVIIKQLSIKKLNYLWMKINYVFDMESGRQLCIEDFETSLYRLVFMLMLTK